MVPLYNEVGKMEESNRKVLFCAEPRKVVAMRDDVMGRFGFATENVSLGYYDLR